MDKGINFSLNQMKTVTVVTNPKTSFHCGCKLLEVTFPEPILVEVSFVMKLTGGIVKHSTPIQ